MFRDKDSIRAAIILVAVAVLSLIYQFSTSESASSQPQPTLAQKQAEAMAAAAKADATAKDDAKWACRQFVERSLKAPSTADFPFVNEFTAVGKERGPYIVRGYVDAQNSFGAMLRTNFACELHTDGKEWFLDNLTMNQ